MTPLEWMMSGDTGVSSKTIMHVMEGTAAPSDVDVPHDPSDFGRCHRLLEAFPSYAARLGEVAEKYPDWVGLVREWGTLTEMYCVALNTGAERATELYNRMEELIDEGRRAAGWTETAPGCWKRDNSLSVQIGDGVRIVANPQ